MADAPWPFHKFICIRFLSQLDTKQKLLIIVTKLQRTPENWLPGIRENSIRRCLYHRIIWRKKTKQILKIILSLGAAELSLLCGLNAEKLFVKNLGLLTIPIPNREIEPYTVITEDMFTTTELIGYIKEFDYGKNLLFLLMNRFSIKTDINKAITKAAQYCEKNLEMN